MSDANLKQTSPPQRLRLRGILAMLPDALPYYPYNCSKQLNNIHLNAHKRRGRRRGRTSGDDLEASDPSQTHGNTDDAVFIPNAHLCTTPEDSNDGFTLFFFVDSTNRQSLFAIPVVSKWFHHAMNAEESTTATNRVICIPNQPAQNKCDNSPDTAQSSDDPIVQLVPILLYSGFHHLPFHHSARLPLLRLLSASRVPSIIVVRNDTGRIVTPYGWEAIEREGGTDGVLDQWIARIFLEKKKYDSTKQDANDKDLFDSFVHSEWKNGKSGLPLWWHILSWIV